MKNERRNAQTKATHQNTEPVWDATGRTQRHPLDEYQHSLWAGQKNQDRPQRKRRRDPAPAHRKGRRPARDVLGTEGEKNGPTTWNSGVSYSPGGIGRYVSNNREWLSEVGFSCMTLGDRVSRWKAWCCGELNLRETFPGCSSLVPADPPVVWIPARAPQVS